MVDKTDLTATEAPEHLSDQRPGSYRISVEAARSGAAPVKPRLVYSRPEPDPVWFRPLDKP